MLHSLKQIAKKLKVKPSRLTYNKDEFIAFLHPHQKGKEHPKFEDQDIEILRVIMRERDNNTEAEDIKTKLRKRGYTETLDYEINEQNEAEETKPKANQQLATNYIPTIAQQQRITTEESIKATHNALYLLRDANETNTKQTERIASLKEQREKDQHQIQEMTARIAELEKEKEEQQKAYKELENKKLVWRRLNGGE